MATSLVTSINKSGAGIRTGYQLFSEYLRILSELTKFRITFFVSVTTFVGYILHKGKIDPYFVLPTLGVLILASGASALNEYQERILDAKMPRTKLRPIPSGNISEAHAISISIILIFSGSAVLALHSIEIMLLGLFTLLWYNGIYTPLKKITPYAIIPGSLVGSLPPVIGWVASGGNILEWQILALAAFMFIWQIPHFWLLVLMYDKQYKVAGFPTLSDKLNLNQITKITYLWIGFLIISSSLFYLSGLVSTYVSISLLTLAGILTFYLTFKLTKDLRKEIFGKSFLLINAYVLFILILISIENII